MLVLAMFFVIYMPVIQSEEAYLREKFSGFDAYARSVPRLLPRLSPLHNPPGSFSRALYLQHREYNAILGTVGVMAALVAKLYLHKI